MKIITHGGQAHADEVLAIALILINEEKTPIEVQVIRTLEDKRARVWKEEGADFVVDIGGDSDHRKGWFDHHQFPRDAKACCAFTLVARKYKVDLSFFDWAHKLAVIDSKGPRAWFQEVMGRPPKVPREVSMLTGSADSFFVYLAKVASRNFDKGICMAMEWLENEFREVQDLKEGLARSLAIVKIVDCDGFKMAFYDQKDPRGSLAATEKLTEIHKDIIVAAMRDERGDGYSAVRTHDNPRVDFSPREKDKGCIFAHKSGFIMKWEDDWESFVTAVKRSVNNSNAVKFCKKAKKETVKKKKTSKKT